MNDNYQSLANAIVLSAVKDYRKALHTLSLNPGNRMARYEIKKIERFFRSRYFEILTSLDPEVLIERLDKKAVINKKEVAV